MVIKCASNWQVSDQLSCLHQCLWVSLYSSYLFLTWASSKSQHKFEFCQYCTQSMQAQFNHYINVTRSWYSRKCQWPDVFVGNMQLCFLFSMFRNIFPTMLLGNNGVAYKKKYSLAYSSMFQNLKVSKSSGAKIVWFNIRKQWPSVYFLRSSQEVWQHHKSTHLYCLCV